MKSLAYKTETTKDKFTSRAGLALLGRVFQRLGLAGLIDRVFPAPGSNRGYSASVFLKTFILMLNEGGRCLEDVRHLRAEGALLELLGLARIPSADALGDWLRRNAAGHGRERLRQINRAVLKTTLGNCRRVTLDIDATFIEAHKKGCSRSYLKKRGYMPIVGHIAETGQVVAAELRDGNAAPSSRNLEFIRQCQAALPDGVSVRRCRIDAAGYQKSVIESLECEGIQYAIRAKMCADIKEMIEDADKRGLWEPLVMADGSESETEQVCRTLHSMNGMDEAFELVIQRKLKHRAEQDEAEPQSGGETEVHSLLGGAVQLELPLGCALHEEHAEDDRYVHRAIATNLSDMSASEIVHFYNARAEHSENRIKELKNDFAAKHLPCRDFDASALYFDISGLAYNMFVLLRSVLPAEYEKSRAPTVRLRLFDMAGKIVRHARRVALKMNDAQHVRFRRAMASIDLLLPDPVP